MASKPEEKNPAPGKPGRKRARQDVKLNAANSLRSKYRTAVKNVESRPCRRQR